jgi:hypothetical protein
MGSYGVQVSQKAKKRENSYKTDAKRRHLVAITIPSFRKSGRAVLWCTSKFILEVELWLICARGQKAENTRMRSSAKVAATDDYLSAGTGSDLNLPLANTPAA